MKHPGLVRKINDIEYEQLYKQHAGRYIAWLFSGLLILCLMAWYFLYPGWPLAVLLVLYCAGFILCLAISSTLGHRRARKIMQSRGETGARYSPPDELI